MARQTVKTTTARTTRTRVKKNGSTNSGGYKKCPNCGGDGIVRVRKKGK